MDERRDAEGDSRPLAEVRAFRCSERSSNAAVSRLLAERRRLRVYEAVRVGVRGGALYRGRRPDRCVVVDGERLGRPKRLRRRAAKIPG